MVKNLGKSMSVKSVEDGLCSHSQPPPQVSDHTSLLFQQLPLPQDHL
jgi:hypothetical protein